MLTPVCSPVRRGHSPALQHSPAEHTRKSSPAGGLDGTPPPPGGGCAGTALMPPPGHPFWREPDVAQQASARTAQIGQRIACLPFCLLAAR
jgi:hypothetical protein